MKKDKQMFSSKSSPIWPYQWESDNAEQLKKKSY